MDVGEVAEASGSGTSMVRTVDGRWVSTWETGLDPHNGLKRFNLDSGSETAIIYVMDEAPAEQMISFLLYGGETPEDSLIASVYRQNLPTNSGILTIDAEGLSTFSSFSKEDDMDVVKITKGSPVSLAWVDLADTPASSWTWTDNGSQVSDGNNYTFTEADTVDHTVTCTAAGETHKVVIKFVEPS